MVDMPDALLVFCRSVTCLVNHPITQRTSVLERQPKYTGRRALRGIPFPDAGGEAIMALFIDNF